MKAITKDTLLDFETKLIELGELYKVNEDHTITSRATDQLVTVMDGKTSKTVVFFYEGMLMNKDLYIFNPFKESIGINPARDWFYGELNAIVGMMLKALMVRVVKDAVNKDDGNYKQFPLMSRIMDKVDEAMIDEIEKIRTLDLILIFYNKTKKTAEAQCAVLTDEYRQQHTKFRKKTWEVLEILIEAFLGTLEVSETYNYTATLLNIPETDAKLHVIIGLVRTLHPWCRDITGLDLHIAELDEHLEALEGYAKLYAWVSQSSALSTATQSVAPWNRGLPTTANNQPAQVVPAWATPPPPQMLQPVSVVPAYSMPQPCSYAGPGMPVSAVPGSLSYPPYGGGSYNI